MDRTCLECDVSLAGMRPTAKYCSERHRVRAEKRRGEKRARARVRARASWVNGVCEVCESSYERHRRSQRFCSRACYEDSRKVDCAGGCGKRIFKSATSAEHPRCRGCERGPDGLTAKDRRRRGAYVLTCAACGVADTIQPHKGPRGRYCNACSELAKSCRFRPCSECGEDAWLGTNVQRCSSCWAAYRRSFMESRLPVVYEGPAWAPPVVHVRSRWTWNVGRCVVCSGWFTAKWRERTCSDSCWRARRREDRRRIKAERRARKRGAFRAPVIRRRVFESDGWRCHLCGLLTDRSKQVPHPKAPTIDHVVPLAVGGTHEPSNCRTAHFLCNAVKGDRGGGEQLILLAV